MKVFFVGAGPGDVELLTVKARRLLESARCCIYAGSLVNPELLDLLPPGAQRHDSASMDLAQIVAVIRQAHSRDTDVVRLHTGRAVDLRRDRRADGRAGRTGHRV